MRRVLAIVVLLALVTLVSFAADLEVGQTAYVIHDGQPLLVSKDPDAMTMLKLKSHQPYKVAQISGKWVQLRVGFLVGWVYAGNLSSSEPSEASSSGLSTEASATTLSAAARGIDDDAKGYADRKGEAESANDVVWMEQANDAIGKDDVHAYQKEHNMGDNSGGK